MRSKLLLVTTAFAALALAPFGATAQNKPAGTKVDAFMQQWDTDHDGTLSADEVKKAADARFDALDGDHDNTLDRKELRGIVSATEMTKADGDNDKTLDKTSISYEFNKGFPRKATLVQQGKTRQGIWAASRQGDREIIQFTEDGAVLPQQYEFERAADDPDHIKVTADPSSLPTPYVLKRVK